jgi:hypothetical protein
MSDRRRKDVTWDVADESGAMPTWERVGIAVLMDIRDELKVLNSILRCPNFQAIPFKLDRISRNTAKPKVPALQAGTKRKNGKKT